MTEAVKIFDEKIINSVAKKYNVLDYSKKLIEYLNKIYPTENFSHFPKYELHRLLNEVLVTNYCGEEVHKYFLFQNHYYKKNVVAAFEMKVNSSRVDFLTINGFTTSYEIKSELDNLSKLTKQATDYLLAFDYNYIVVDDVHVDKAIDLIPNSFGIWGYKNGKYRKHKKASLNTNIDSEVQLRLLTKKELIVGFPELYGDKCRILKTYNSESINLQFKKILKQRYKSRWDFLVENQQSIFPVDLQFFFNTNILPRDIYFH